MKVIVLLFVITGAILSSCTQTKEYKDKMIELASNDLHKQVKVPSTFIIDSTKVKLVENHIYDRYIGLYQVEIFYQSENSYGALLKGEALYYIKRNPQSGKISIYDKYLSRGAK